MVRPTTFGFNTQAAKTNAYMHRPSTNEASVRDAALAEFDTAVSALRAKNIDVVVWDAVPRTPLPDALFPNNWLTSWDDGTLFLYPMSPISRRGERQPALIESLKAAKIVDLSPSEHRNVFLEGTGAMVFDHDNRIIFATPSPRCNPELLRAHTKQLGYRTVTFKASHRGTPVYHTNLVMSILSNTAVVCTEVIALEAEKIAVLEVLKQTGHEIVDISADQLSKFCGNILAVANRQGKVFIVMSQSAFDAFTPAQRTTLSKYADLLPVALPVIERVSGGSARCMLAELCF